MIAQDLTFSGGPGLRGRRSSGVGSGARVTDAFGPKVLWFIGGGVLLGFGSRLANGCTSGHGIVGTALLAKSSWLATATFMAAGFLVTHWLLGGAA